MPAIGLIRSRAIQANKPIMIINLLISHKVIKVNQSTNI